MSPWAAEPRQAPPPRPGDGPQEPELRRARGASGQGPAQPGGHGETQPRAPTAADGPTEARGMSRSEWVLPAPPRAHGGGAASGSGPLAGPGGSGGAPPRRAGQRPPGHTPPGPDQPGDLSGRALAAGTGPGLTRPDPRPHSTGQHYCPTCPGPCQQELFLSVFM